MAIKHLYIIGNGFDIHHGIKSGYNEFHKWLQNNTYGIAGFDELFGWVDSSWWSDFENNLGEVNTFEYAMDIARENPPDLLSEHCDRTWNDAQVYVEEGLKDVYESVKKHFSSWILSLNSFDYSRRIRLQKNDSAFLTFNYTRTLEDYYGISENIVHIHGSVDNKQFVIGHGKTSQDLKNEANIQNTNQNHDDCDEITDEGLELHEQLAYDEAINSVAKYRKPVEQIIKKYEDFFKSLSTVEDIHIYGFSFSDIDIPYIREIIKYIKLGKVSWEVSDFNNENKEKIQCFFKSRGIKNYTIIELSSLIIGKVDTLIH